MPGAKILRWLTGLRCRVGEGRGRSVVSLNRHASEASASGGRWSSQASPPTAKQWNWSALISATTFQVAPAQYPPWAGSCPWR